MKFKIQHRLFLALLAASGLAVISMLFIMQWSIDRGFLRYINNMDAERLDRLAGALQDAYAVRNSWEFLRQDRTRWMRVLLQSLPDADIDQELLKRLREQPGADLQAKEHNFEARVFLLDADENMILGVGPLPVGLDLIPLTHDDQMIGYLGFLPRKQISDIHQLKFVRQLKVVMAMIAGVILLIAALLSMPLAKRLVQPIRALASGARRLSSGDFTARVAVGSVDELGQLARDFNGLALTLEKNERSRRQWVADISHELRTPLAILRGEIEAIEDGVRPPTAGAIRSLHAEIMHLSRLVDDLYQLSRSDAGGLTFRKEQLQPLAVLGEAIEGFRPEFMKKGIALSVILPEVTGPHILADRERLRQLFTNLLRNSCKYTDRGGRAEVIVAWQEGQLQIHFQDSAPGVPDSDLARLFDRFYRVEGSRSRSSGGSGLGLAICRNIVEAHGGVIAAHHSPLGGLRITVTMPLA